jgi:hypothetical protein
MKKIALFLVFIFISSFVFVRAQDDQKKNTPSGMKEIQLGSGAKRLVPDDAIVQKQGSSLIVESYEENASRRIARAETNIVRLDKEMQDLKSSLAQKDQVIKNLETEIRLLKKLLAETSKIQVIKK